MLTGKKAFEGKSQASLIGAIISKDPTPRSPRCSRSRRRRSTASSGHASRRILTIAGSPRATWHDELKWIAEGGNCGRCPSARARATRGLSAAAWITAAAGALIALFIVLRPASAPVTGDVVRLSILPPDKTLFTGHTAATVGGPQLALSPDGRAIVFVAAAPGARPTLWLRSLDAVTAHSLPGTEGAESPFWSPDDRWIGYFADGKLKKMPASGGPSQVIANAPDNRLASWGPDDTILFSTGIDWHSAGVIVRRNGHAGHRTGRVPPGRIASIPAIPAGRSSLPVHGPKQPGGSGRCVRRVPRRQDEEAAHSWQHGRALCALRPCAVPGWRHPDGPGI